MVVGEGAARTTAVCAPLAVTLEVASRADDRLAPVIDGWPRGPLPPALVSGGRAWWLVQLASEDALRALAPDMAAVGALAARTDSTGVAAFAFCAAAACAPHDVAVRAFVGAVAPPFEDAASGAANAVLAAWLNQRCAWRARGGVCVCMCACVCVCGGM